MPYYAIPAKFAYFDKLSEFRRGFAKKSKEAKIHFTNDTITATVVKVVSSHEQAATFFFIKANKHDGKKPQRNDNIPVSLVNDC